MIKTLEWVAMPSSRGSSSPRYWTSVSCRAGRCFTAELLSKHPHPVSPCLKKWSENHSVVSDSLIRHGLYSPWDSSSQNTPFPGDLPNPGLPHRRQILYKLSYNRNPRLLEWVVYHFSSGFSQPRDQTRVSCIASGFFPKWVMREVVSLSLSLCMYVYIHIHTMLC